MQTDTRGEDGQDNSQSLIEPWLQDPWMENQYRILQSKFLNTADTKITFEFYNFVLE